jgi:hypothetical protein
MKAIVQPCARGASPNLLQIGPRRQWLPDLRLLCRRKLETLWRLPDLEALTLQKDE